MPDHLCAKVRHGLTSYSQFPLYLLYLGAAQVAAEQIGNITSLSHMTSFVVSGQTFITLVYVMNETTSHYICIFLLQLQYISQERFTFEIGEIIVGYLAHLTRGRSLSSSEIANVANVLRAMVALLEEALETGARIVPSVKFVDVSLCLQ